MIRCSQKKQLLRGGGVVKKDTGHINIIGLTHSLCLKENKNRHSGHRFFLENTPLEIDEHDAFKWNLLVLEDS